MECRGVGKCESDACGKLGQRTPGSAKGLASVGNGILRPLFRVPDATTGNCRVLSTVLPKYGFVQASMFYKYICKCILPSQISKGTYSMKETLFHFSHIRKISMYFMLNPISSKRSKTTEGEGTQVFKWTVPPCFHQAKLWGLQQMSSPLPVLPFPLSLPLLPSPLSLPVLPYPRMRRSGGRRRRKGEDGGKEEEEK